MDQTALGVLVAVGPAGVHDGTLDLAAAEAMRLGTGVELLHVVHSSLLAVPTGGAQADSVDRALTKVGHDVLSEAVDRMSRRLAGQVSLSARLVSGPVARTIAAQGSRRRLIVLERRDSGVLERLATMSVSTSVAAQATVPVVVVPATWSGALSHDLPLTVGVDDPMDLGPEVPQALDYARDTGRSPVVLHAVWLAEPYQDAAFAEYPRDRWISDATRELESALAGVSAEGVACDVRWARPVDALVAASQRSSMLVLNRRPAARPLAAHLGPVTRAVMHLAACPVMVVDRGGHDDRAGQRTRGAGAAR